jgi:hypothetical protein
MHDRIKANMEHLYLIKAKCKVCGKKNQYNIIMDNYIETNILVQKLKLNLCPKCKIKDVIERYKMKKFTNLFNNLERLK